MKDNSIVVRKVIDITEEVISQCGFILQEERNGEVTDIIYDPIYLYECNGYIYGAFTNYLLDDDKLKIMFYYYSKNHSEDFDVDTDLDSKEEKYLKKALKDDEVKDRIKRIGKIVKKLSHKVRDFNEDVNAFNDEDSYSQERISKCYDHFMKVKECFSNLSLLETKILSNWGIDYTSLIARVDAFLDMLGNKKFALERREDQLPLFDNKQKDLEKDVYEELGIPEDFQNINPKYMVKSFVDESSGGLSPYKLELLINYYYENGWKLYKVFTNKIGNKSINGFSIPTGSIEQTIVVFERMDEDL